MSTITDPLFPILTNDATGINGMYQSSIPNTAIAATPDSTSMMGKFISVDSKYISNGSGFFTQMYNFAIGGSYTLAGIGLPPVSLTSNELNLGWSYFGGSPQVLVDTHTIPNLVSLGYLTSGVNISPQDVNAGNKQVQQDQAAAAKPNNTMIWLIVGGAVLVFVGVFAIKTGNKVL